MTRVPFLLAITIFVVGISSPLDAQIAGDSELSAWAVDASLMVEGGESAAGRIAEAPCSTIHASIDSYKADPPAEDQIPPELVGSFKWSEFMQHYDLTDGQVTSLQVRFGWSRADIFICTTLHVDGWLQADESIVALVEDPPGLILVVTTVGEPQCEHGQVLLTSASYYWSTFTGQWEYGYGTDWTENFFGGFTVTADIEFRCIEIYPTEDDFAEVAEGVPSTQVNYNPLVVGLTGLDTWLWYEFDTPDTYSIGPLTVSINRFGRTWTLTAWAWVDSVHWDVDCEVDCSFRGDLDAYDLSEFEYSFDFGDTPGEIAAFYDGGADNEDDALATHLYEEKGFYTVSTATVWRGYYTSNGVPTLYDPVIVVDERPYEVQEIRGVLTSPTP